MGAANEALAHVVDVGVGEEGWRMPLTEERLA